MEKQWWQNRTAYQIYPKSFLDTNGDGIGDLPGIIEKLDYLKDLGIGILWISPVYVSPCADQGYDIADYYGIDPKFGTMEDMDRLLAEAKKRDIAVLMDLVVNHCSDEHEWFQKALKDPEGEYGQYFYFAKKKDGKLPCNWRSYFGGSVWENVEGTDWYYLHMFHKKQPDLNWENPKLREEIYKMMNWWLDKGIAGFRVDAIMNIKKPLPFQDYPADREDGLCNVGGILGSQEGLRDFLNEMHEKTTKPHHAFSVGEVFGLDDSDISRFIGDDAYFTSIFDFRQNVAGQTMLGWYDWKAPTPDEYKECCFTSQKVSEGVGFFSNIIENHDEPRGVSHYLPEYAQNEKGKKLLGMMYFMLKGLPFIYQGQELGMENCAFPSIEAIDDVSSRDEYQRCLKVGLNEEEALKVVSHYSRDNGRTPFQWNDEKNGGFTTGTPWLMVNPQYKEINATSQIGKEGSIYEFYKSMIALRRDGRYEDTIVYGVTEPVLEDQKRIMAYFRRGGKQDILVIGNFRDEAAEVEIPELKGKTCQVLLNNGGTCMAVDGKVKLEALQGVVFEVK